MPVPTRASRSGRRSERGVASTETLVIAGLIVAIVIAISITFRKDLTTAIGGLGNRVQCAVSGGQGCGVAAAAATSAATVSAAKNSYGLVQAPPASPTATRPSSGAIAAGAAGAASGSGAVATGSPSATSGPGVVMGGMGSPGGSAAAQLIKDLPWPAGPQPPGVSGGTLELERHDTVNEAAAKHITDYLNQYKGTAFSNVVKLGNPDTYKNAVTTDLNIKVGTGTTGKRAQGSHEASGLGLNNTIHVPFDPRDPLNSSQKQTLHHETTHQIEWHHGFQKNAGVVGTMPGYKERNTAYMDRVVGALTQWARTEFFLRKGSKDGYAPDAEQVKASWHQLASTLTMLERGYGASEVDGAEGQWWPPDLDQLEKYTGFRARLSDIREYYLTGSGCADLGLDAAGCAAFRRSITSEPPPR